MSNFVTTNTPSIIPRRRGDTARPATQENVSLPSQGGTIIGCKNLKKTYSKGSTKIPVLQGVDLEIRRGEFVAIIGQSGSGKSTLLHLLATLDYPDAGEVWFDGRRIDNLSGKQKDAIRNAQIGMIFQFYHLLPELSALENALAPMMISHSVWQYWKNRKTLAERASSLLQQVGLTHRLTHRPREMSGGEMQRVAIARALISTPQILMADEPTGNLDRSTGEEVLGILRNLNRSLGLTIVMVTHDPAIAAQASRTVRLSEGKLVAASR